MSDSPSSAGATRLAFSPEELRRVEAVDRLAVDPAVGLNELLAMLDDPSWSVRRAVVAALAASGDVAVAPLIQVLRDRRDSEARIAAVVDTLAASMGNADTGLEALAHEVSDPAVLADVAQILGRRRTSSGVATLVALTRAVDDNVAVAAIEALGRIGGRAAVDSLVATVNSGNFFRTFPAIDVLGRSGDPRAVAPLTALLEQPHYVAEAARALGRTGDIGAVAPLMRLLLRAGAATVRVAAIALKDLLQRHRERFGNDEAIAAAIRLAGGDAGVARQLTRALTEGDAAEQAAICFLLGESGDPAAATALTARLDASSPEVAGAATAALRRLGPQADEQILVGLRTGDVAQRCALLPLVARAAAAPAVVACLGDGDPEVRALACDALARMGVTSVVGALFPLLADANPRVAFAATAAIQSLGSHETETLARAALGSPDARVRRAAVRILGYFGAPTMVADVLGALSDEDERVRESAIQALPFLDDPRALETLLAAARDPSERTRAAAMRSLGQSSGDLRVSSFLLRGLSDQDAWVRYYACQALGKLAFAPATEAIVRLLHDPAGQVRVAAVEALSCMPGEPAIEALKIALHDADGDVRRTAIIGLGVAKRDETLPLMMEAAVSSDAATRLVALSAFGGFRAPEVLRALHDAASDEDESVRTAAIGFLAATPGIAATQTLTELLRETTNREPIIEALSLLSEGRVAGLQAALETSDDELSAALTSALTRLHRPDATAVLLGAMTMPNVAARKAAASALGARVNQGGPAGKAALAALTKAAHEDPESEVRQICSLLLARLAG
ncbi:MAG TPA: HEAT repeat domain-containing protein [Polyangia bacterium]|jgi:HEAT repeat protein